MFKTVETLVASTLMVSKQLETIINGMRIAVMNAFGDEAVPAAVAAGTSQALRLTLELGGARAAIDQVQHRVGEVKRGQTEAEGLVAQWEMTTRG